MRAVDASSLARYADAIVRDGLRIGEGDVLAVHPEPIQRELAVALTDAGYRAGARYVDVLETDPRITRSRALGAPEDTLDWRPAWADPRQQGPAGARRRAAGARGAPRHGPRGPAALPQGRRQGRRALRRDRVAV